MNTTAKYSFNLPPETEVILRNRTITTYYAQLYKNEPNLYKWAGMAAFASFHIGTKLKLWDWENTPLKTFSNACKKKNRTIEDDFQIIRIINNKIFTEIGSIHLAFSQLEFDIFKNQLIQTKKNEIIIEAFNKLNEARTRLNAGETTEVVEKLIWEANIEILWHEQLFVVQPMFDKLSNTFSNLMSLIASFDYHINHKKTSWKLASRFIIFMFTKGLITLSKNYFIPNITHFEQRWSWISKDILAKWQALESNQIAIQEEISFLTQLEDRQLKLYKLKT
ncbi:DUF2515 family protein [Tenacibaculum jejuense]|uniref:Uncharacterized protein n=1 Tax=Tenacibaculum jejuense TaxID=584609 RepID=A0A238U3T5_9FLAO|nr:hypothetical protein [Tenacibaculum jejuense]SNR13871.1 protein of unknown function [Tenacibaculum jejuense]